MLSVVCCVYLDLEVISGSLGRIVSDLTNFSSHWLSIYYSRCLASASWVFEKVQYHAALARVITL